MSDYSKDFLSVVDRNFGFEGGEVNDSRDRGGHTNLGVTASTLAEYNRVKITNHTVSDLTYETALDVYYVLFWQRFSIDHWPEELRLPMFNALTGSPAFYGQMVRIVQALVGAKVDGGARPGGETFAKAAAFEDKEALTNSIIDMMNEYLIGLCVRDTSQIAFMLGWFRRYREFYILRRLDATRWGRQRLQV